VGTVIRGVRGPIVREGDDIGRVVVDSVMECVQGENITLHDRDIVAVTESVVARAQGNYATVDQIGADVARHFPTGEFGVIFPIMSRNRFSVLLRGILKGAKRVTMMLSYPSDEVGNEIISLDAIDQAGVNPYSDVLTEEEFTQKFGDFRHPFTGVNYVTFYKSIAAEMQVDMQIILANDARTILKYTKNVLCCDIHSRNRSKRLLKAAGGELVFGLDDILKESVNGSGFNPDYGLLGTNLATETKVKLFPRECRELAIRIQSELKDRTGKMVEVLVYGDGAFKDPVGKIWELADPVVSPGYTPGLEGTPHEVKLKYLADNQYASLTGEELRAAITQHIHDKSIESQSANVALGTTPRRLTDLIGSLCDLSTGSGDKGTPIVLIQGYFDNYSS